MPHARSSHPRHDLARAVAGPALLDNGADANLPALGSCGRPLHTAARTKNLPVAMLLLSKGARVNEVGPGGTTALHCATKHPGSPAIVRLLIQNGADAFQPDASGRSPMQQAVLHGDGELLAALRKGPGRR